MHNKKRDNEKLLVGEINTLLLTTCRLCSLQKNSSSKCN